MYFFARIQSKMRPQKVPIASDPGFVPKTYCAHYAETALVRRLMGAALCFAKQSCVYKCIYIKMK